MKDEGTSFGLWLQQRRKELDLTRRDLAWRAGCSAKTVEKIETGERRPSKQIAECLAGCLDIPQEERSKFVEFARAELAAEGSAQLAQTNSHTPWRTFHRLQHPSNLPAHPNDLVGRAGEIEAACTLLRRPGVRLLTLIGAPGVGKTRLALRVASDLADDFSDGVFLVLLAPITDAGLVASTVVRTLSVQEVAGRSPFESLQAYLQDKQTLLVLDNFEQVAAAAPVIAQLLEAAPQVKVLVTSRVVLHIYGEHDFEVPPLALPPAASSHDAAYTQDTADGLTSVEAIKCLPQYDAVRLFLERAQAARSDFKLTPENVSVVGEICRHLDGLPLAIELAAARIRILTPSAMLARLSSRLKLLTGGAQDLPVRHQTLRSAIAWSYDLLEEEDKKLFRRLGVFVGGRTLEAIEAVCNANCDLTVDVLDGVESLISKSLVQQVEGAGGEPRFVMLATIHEYAREKLDENGEAEELSRQHAHYFLALAERAEEELTGERQAKWLARLEEEHGNLRAALRRSSDNRRSRNGRDADVQNVEDEELELRLAGALWKFWYVHGHFSEGRQQLFAVLHMADMRTRKQDDIVTGQTVGLGAHSAARAKALLGAGWLAWTQGDYASASSFSKESLAIYRELGDKEGVALSLNNLGMVAQNQGDLGSARSLFEESLAIGREFGSKRAVAASINNLGVVARDQGDYDLACSLHAESLAMRTELGDRRGIAVSLTNLAEVARKQGDYDAARSLYQKSLAIRVELGYKWGFAGCLAGLAKVTASQSIVERAVRLWGAAEALREALGTTFSAAELAEYERDLAAARAQLDEVRWRKVWDEGRAMTLEQAIAYALEVKGVVRP